VICCPTDWEDFELLDSGDGAKLERWGEVLIVRPDPQALWSRTLTSIWKEADYNYIRSEKGGGYWESRNKIVPTDKLPAMVISYHNFRFQCRLTKFKHTLLFPEQAVNWKKIISMNPKKLLNLFAYTGGATLAALSSGANTTHVDASGVMIGIAQKNLQLSSLNHSKVRFIKDDVIKFVDREVRRGNTYDSVVLDPPAYGRGSNGEIWQIDRALPSLLKQISSLLDKSKKFLILNVYANEFSTLSFVNICKQIFIDAEVSSYELGLVNSSNKMILPTGSSIFVKF